jgi:hypothetical protein
MIIIDVSIAVIYVVSNEDKKIRRTWEISLNVCKS